MDPANHTDPWELFRQGDTGAFAGLYNTYYGDLLRFGVHYCGDADLVRDEINQQFLQLWDKREALPSVGNIRAYLLTSFRNRLVNALKKDGLIVPIMDTAETSPSWEQELIGIEDQENLLESVKKAIRALPPRQRELVFLRYYQGMPAHAIAEKTSLSISTVYNTLHSALEKMRQDLGPRHARQLDRLLSLLFCLA